MAEFAYGEVHGIFTRVGGDGVDSDLDLDVRADECLEVDFVPSAKRVSIGGRLVGVDPVKCRIASDGRLVGANSLSPVRLLATDQGNPDGWHWTACFGRADWPDVDFLLPAGGVVDVAGLVPVDVGAGVLRVTDEALAARAEAALGAAEGAVSRADAAAGKAEEALSAANAAAASAGEAVSRAGEVSAKADSALAAANELVGAERVNADAVSALGVRVGVLEERPPAPPVVGGAPAGEPVIFSELVPGPYDWGTELVLQVRRDGDVFSVVDSAGRRGHNADHAGLFDVGHQDYPILKRCLTSVRHPGGRVDLSGRRVFFRDGELWELVESAPATTYEDTAEEGIDIIIDPEPTYETRRFDIPAEWPTHGEYILTCGLERRLFFGTLEVPLNKFTFDTPDYYGVRVKYGEPNVRLAIRVPVGQSKAILNQATRVEFPAPLSIFHVDHFNELGDAHIGLNQGFSMNRADLDEYVRTPGLMVRITGYWLMF